MNSQLEKMKSYRNSQKDSIDIIEIINIFWTGKLKILLFSLFALTFGIIYSLSLPSIYTSTSVLAPSSGSSSSSSSSQYSNIASFAGISIPSPDVDKVLMGIEIIKSLDFYIKFVSRHNLYIPLQASTGWNAKNNELIIDPDIYNSSQKAWVSKKAFSIEGKPSMQEAHRNFLKSLSITKDSKTGFIIISFNHYSPFVAKRIIDLLIIDINEISRSEDIAIANDSISFLTAEANKAQLSEIRISINNLIQSQIETKTLANAKPEYLLKILSAPAAPELKSQPSRSIIVIFITFFGFSIGAIFTILSHYIFKKKF